MINKYPEYAPNHFQKCYEQLFFGTQNATCLFPEFYENRPITSAVKTVFASVDEA